MSPLYEYRCVRCRSVTPVFRALEDRDRPDTCPECGGPARRIFSVPQKPVVVWSEKVDPERLRTTKEIWE